METKSRFVNLSTIQQAFLAMAASNSTRHLQELTLVQLRTLSGI